VGKKRRKVRHNVTRGIVYIKATFNNTMVTITDMNGDTLCWASAGTVGKTENCIVTVHLAYATGDFHCFLSSAYSAPKPPMPPSTLRVKVLRASAPMRFLT